MTTTNCRLCGRDASKGDPAYPNHYDCVAAFYEEMERFGIIIVVSIVGTKTAWTFADHFKEVLDKEIAEASRYLIPDETVDPDVVSLMGVVRAIKQFLPENAPLRTLDYSSGMIFEALMKVKYGEPLPPAKWYGTMMKEFSQVSSIPLGRTETEFIKKFREMSISQGQSKSETVIAMQEYLRGLWEHQKGALADPSSPDYPSAQRIQREIDRLTEDTEIQMRILAAIFDAMRMDNHKTPSKSRWLAAGEKWGVKPQIIRYINANWTSYIRQSEIHEKHHHGAPYGTEDLE